MTFPELLAELSEGKVCDNDCDGKITHITYDNGDEYFYPWCTPDYKEWGREVLFERRRKVSTYADLMELLIAGVYMWQPELEG